MSETMDYAPVLNAMEPPEGLVHWVLGQGKLQHEVLLYKAGWAYEPLEDRNVPVVEVTCSGCGRTFHARKITAGGCCSSYAPAPFGWWNELTGEAVISGSHSTCPYCSTAAEVKHVSAVPGGVDQYWNMAAKLEMDLDSDQVRYPKDLKAAHDRAVERFNLQKDQLVQAGFDKRRAELEKFAWERDGILIRPCASQTELRHEGKCLSHCVASYGKYQNTMEMFNAAWGGFVAWFAETYRPADGCPKEGYE